MIPVCPDCSKTVRFDRAARALWTRFQFGTIVVFLDPEEIALACPSCGWTGSDLAVSLDTRTGDVVLFTAGRLQP